MPLITHVLLYIGYALIAATTGIALERFGGGTSAEAFLGGIALFAAAAITHGGIAAAYAAGAVRHTERRLKADIERVRASHREVIADIDAVAARVDALDRSVLELSTSQRLDIPRPQQQPELGLLDQIVSKLANAMDSRFDEMRRLTGPTSAAPLAPGPIELVREALHENRIELHLQPIVSLPQRKTVFYEGFTRLKDESGRLILPQEFIPAAEKAGLMSAIDNLLLFRCVQIVRKLMKQDRRVGIFCNLASHALSDDTFFPQFLEFMREHQDLAGAVIFEMTQASFENRTSTEARSMGKLADLGFRFSIDRVERLDLDLADLERASVRYVKAPASVLTEQLSKRGVRPRSAITREIAAGDVTAVFQRYGIDVIAERVESEALVLEALDLEVPYGQGHLFGPPRAIKESLMEETAPPKDFLLRQRGAA